MNGTSMSEKIEEVLYTALPFLEESNPHRVIDMAITFGLQLIATLVLFLIIRYKFWNLITGIIEKRKQNVEEALALKKEALDDVEKARNQLEQVKVDTLKTADKIINEARIESEQTAKKMIDDANIQIERNKQDALELIEKQQKEMQNGIKNEVVDIAFAMAEKMVGREIDQDKNKDIVDEALSKLNN